MHARLLTPSWLALLITGSLLVATARAAGCAADNCARAVTGTRRGAAAQASAKADCNSFMAKTITAPAITITSIVTATVAPAASAPVKRDSLATPAYASACSGASRYSSACSCWGITGTTVTVIPTSTAAITITAIPSPATTYTPDIPPSYTNCVFNPDAGTSFDVLAPANAGGLPIVKNGTLAVVSSATPAPVRYKAIKPLATPRGVYDIVLDTPSTFPTQFLAIFDDGAVGFTTVSSKSQQFITSEQGRFITSVFSFTCDGRITAGIVGAEEFRFAVAGDGKVLATGTETLRVGA
ncbi:hypothetical protein B0H63DRAFT_467850 [Podospora didyma]|uniref:Uncharacterized protein n=1 Tax=Podospora didyma TaxID=330526 RepID=A0AAE0U0I5_9PEZI|nr:hypothetical protein B0H63DRAFT_467850 [Podospora didyma]